MLRDALLDAWALLLPVDCAGCGAPDRSLCAPCVAGLRPRPSSHSLPDGTRVICALDYGGVVRDAILSLKEHGRTDVARRLAVPLALAMTEAMSSPVLAQAQHAASTAGSASTDAHRSRAAAEVLTVPTSRAAYRRRGYDPVALLVRRAGFRPAAELVTTRNPTQQKRLAAAERATNRFGSLRARRRLDGRRFVLVDDVLTTGSTLVEAIRAVRAAGGEIVSAATLAYTPRLIPHPNVRSLNVS